MATHPSGVPAQGPAQAEALRPTPTRRVVVVTDSTCGLPDGLAEQLGITTVPLPVHIGGRTGLEGLDVLPSDVARAMDARDKVSTSPPTAAAFSSAFTAASGLGRVAQPYDIVAVTLSGQLSDTYANAREAAQMLEQTGIRCIVVDGRSTAMGLGFSVLTAARAAAEGYQAQAVARAADDAVRRTDTMLYVDTLEHLRRGGRIGGAQALIGTALSIKPLLHVYEGHIEPLDKQRGAAKALARLEDIAVERSGSGAVQFAVQHLAAPERAEELASRLQRRLGRRVLGSAVSELGAVVGAHVGPGVVGVAIHRL